MYVGLIDMSLLEFVYGKGFSDYESRVSEMYDRVSSMKSLKIFPNEENRELVKSESYELLKEGEEFLKSKDDEIKRQTEGLILKIADSAYEIDKLEEIYVACTFEVKKNSCDKAGKCKRCSRELKHCFYVELYINGKLERKEGEFGVCCIDKILRKFEGFERD